MFDDKKPPLPTEPAISAARTIAKRAFQVEEKSGGFQLFRISLNKDNQMVKRERVGDPDAWDQVIAALEAELALQFQ